MDCLEGSSLFDEFRLQLHRAETVDFAVYIMVAIDEANILYLRADLDRVGCTLDLQILDNGDGVAVLQNIADRILDDLDVAIGLRDCRIPFVGAFRANEVLSIFIGIRRLAFRAGRKCGHGKLGKGVDSHFTACNSLKPGICRFTANRKPPFGGFLFTDGGGGRS